VTYYEFKIYLIIWFVMTFQKTITPSLTSVPRSPWTRTCRLKTRCWMWHREFSFRSASVLSAETASSPKKAWGQFLVLHYLSNDTLSNDKLSNDTLSNDKLSNDTLSNDKLSNDTLSNDKLSNDTLSNDTCATTIGFFLILSRDKKRQKFLCSCK
jgi:pentapeptide MXKDX repeat protein